MASRLCDIDTNIARAAAFAVPQKGLDDAHLIGRGFGNDFLTPEGKLRQPGGKEGNARSRIAFQFPPKVVSDGRDGNWTETAVPGQPEFAVFANSGSRRTTIEWTYIVGAIPGWDSTEVKRNVALLRSYYARTTDRFMSQELVIFLKLWMIGGDQEQTYRMLSVDISHGKTLVAPRGPDLMSPGDLDKTFPLRTDVRADLKVWTDGMGKKEAPEGYEESLSNRPRPGWY